MRAAIARAMMALAARCLGEVREEWARAMQREFHVAVEDGAGLAFAAGCLMAACREMPSYAQGRLAIANHALALGLLIPVAVLQLECVAGLPYLLNPASTSNLYLAEAHRSALLPILALWLLLGVGHLRLAWLVMERDWQRLATVGALTVAASATLMIFSVVLFFDEPSVFLQSLLLIAELGAIYGLARSHARHCPAASHLT